MQDSTRGLIPKHDRIIPDYLGDRYWAKEQAKQIEQFYHKQGHKDVRVWAEAINQESGRKLWVVRSNLVFDCTTVTKE